MSLSYLVSFNFPNFPGRAGNTKGNVYVDIPFGSTIVDVKQILATYGNKYFHFLFCFAEAK